MIPRNFFNNVKKIRANSLLISKHRADKYFRLSVGAKQSLMSEQVSPSCIFCKIAHHEQNSELLYEDEEYAAFRDIRPATPHHYLIIPKLHIPNPRALIHEHIPLVQQLMEIGKQVVEQQGGNTDDIRMGFHWPPFNTVQHLHLHAISLVSQMSFLSRIIFRPDSMWFVSAEAVLERLNKMASSG